MAKKRLKKLTVKIGIDSVKDVNMTIVDGTEFLGVMYTGDLRS